MNERRKKKMDILNREEFIENVIQVVCQLSENKRGCCFAIEGSWGVGKTFVVEEMIRCRKRADCWKRRFRFNLIGMSGKKYFPEVQIMLRRQMGFP